MQPLQLKRALFGYSRRSVMALIGDRDQMFVKASDQARQNELRAGELENNLKETLPQLGKLSEQLEKAVTEAKMLRAERDSLSERAQRTDDDDAKMSRLELEARSSRAEAVEIAEHLRSAESRVAELEDEIESLRTQLQQTRELADASIVVSVSDAPSTAEELSGALDAAEHAVSRIVEAARTRGEEELGVLERAREHVRAEMDRLTSWREAFVPAVQDLRKWMEETREQTLELSDRIREAMGPASYVLEGLTERLTRLSELPEVSDSTSFEHGLDQVLKGSFPAGEEAETLQSESDEASASHPWS